MPFILTRLLLLLAVVAAAGADRIAAGGEEAGARTVIGPANPLLAEGADALLAGDGERGVRLTLQGLGVASGNRERQIGYSNLCGGYIMLRQYTAAVDACDAAIAISVRNWRAYSNRALALTHLGRYEEAMADVSRGLELAPNSTKLREVRGILLDRTDPVAPTIEIDERRDAGAGTPP